MEIKETDMFPYTITVFIQMHFYVFFNIFSENLPLQNQT